MVASGDAALVIDGVHLCLDLKDLGQCAGTSDGGERRVNCMKKACRRTGAGKNGAN